MGIFKKQKQLCPSIFLRLAAEAVVLSYRLNIMMIWTEANLSKKKKKVKATKKKELNKERSYKL